MVWFIVEKEEEQESSSYVTSGHICIVQVIRNGRTRVGDIGFAWSIWALIKVSEKNLFGKYVMIDEVICLL